MIVLWPAVGRASDSDQSCARMGMVIHSAEREIISVVGCGSIFNHKSGMQTGYLSRKAS